MSESRPQSASTLTVPVACGHSPKVESPVGCRARANVGPGGQPVAGAPWLLGARRTSTKNRFRRTNPVRRNTPKRAACAGLGTESARAATHSPGLDHRRSDAPGADHPAPSPLPPPPLPPLLRVCANAGDQPVKRRRLTPRINNLLFISLFACALPF